MLAVGNNESGIGLRSVAGSNYFVAALWKQDESLLTSAATMYFRFVSEQVTGSIKP